MYPKYIKRLLDFCLSLVGLIILLPVYLLIAIFVRIKLGSPAIFKQKRPGKNGKIFTLYKFRTMTNTKNEKGELLSDEERLTKFGKFLRNTSLDELPELLNILKGDMSIVGPRPQLVRDMVFMNEEQKKRHLVRQGLTGLAQISGRNAISWEDKFKYDLEYVKSVTFLKDVKIFFLTMQKVFAKEDISAEGMETAEDFGDYLLRTNQITKEEYEIKQKEAIELLKERSEENDRIKK